MKIHFIFLLLLTSLSLFCTYNTTVNNFLIKNINCHYTFDIVPLKYDYHYNNLKRENQYLLSELLDLKNKCINIHKILHKNTF